MAVDPTVHEGIDDARLAQQLAALAHPARLRIMRALACRRQSCCKDVVAELPLAQSTVSQHLKVLARAGLVIVDRRRPHSHYRVDEHALKALRLDVSDFAGACCREAADPQDISMNDSKDLPIV